MWGGGVTRPSPPPSGPTGGCPVGRRRPPHRFGIPRQGPAHVPRTPPGPMTQCLPNAVGLCRACAALLGPVLRRGHFRMRRLWSLAYCSGYRPSTAPLAATTSTKSCRSTHGGTASAATSHDGMANAKHGQSPPPPV